MTSRLSKSVESPLSSYDSYQMVYNSIEGYAILLGRKVEVNDRLLVLVLPWATGS